MSEILRCYTLFDITSTGIPNRARAPIDVDPNKWLKQRNSQCNFDTILQAISLRSQPEITTLPMRHIISVNTKQMFGNDYSNIDKDYFFWSFDFQVQHTNVFKTKNEELGALYEDCEGIPMLKCGTEHKKLSNFLNINSSQKNIHFIKL